MPEPIRSAHRLIVTDLTRTGTPRGGVIGVVCRPLITYTLIGITHMKGVVRYAESDQRRCG